jgi:N-acetylglutamate synthase-like GNAT family acetyltransferase
MLPKGTTLRRATLDDLETLRGLWRECRLPEYELEKRFTEFQVILDANGWILGALGLRFVAHQGQVHSLSIRRADLHQELLKVLWERAESLSQQHGAYRLWTREPGAFWESLGFQPPDGPVTKELPPAFGQTSEAWRTLKLRDEPLKLIAAEEQLEAYLEMERLKTEQLIRRGQVLKMLATGFAALLFAIALGALVLLLRKSPRKPPRR